jgi:hypothetical protein
MRFSSQPLSRTALIAAFALLATILVDLLTYGSISTFLTRWFDRKVPVDYLIMWVDG